MTTIKPYLIRLTPTGAFFFGGEKSLAGTGNDNYFVRSRYFPQQTSLLGLLRMQLLAAYDLLPEAHLGRSVRNFEEARLYIGQTGFRKDYLGTYGKISALGPVMLARGGEFFAPMSFASAMTFSVKPGRHIPVLAGADASVARDFQPHLTGYNAKQIPETQLFGTEGSAPINIHDVFGERIRVGITKNKKHFAWLYADEKAQKGPDQAEMEGFFKQVSFYFKNATGAPPWQFAFLAWLEAEAAEKLLGFSIENPVVWLGGERSAFRIDIDTLESLPLICPAFPSMEDDITRIVLLTDAWADPLELYAHCRFSHTRALEFRYLESDVEHTKNYYQRGDKIIREESLVRSDKHSFIERGSVFFCTPSQAPALSALLRGPQDFRHIGYNAFTLVSSRLESDFFHPQPSPNI